MKQWRLDGHEAVMYPTFDLIYHWQQILTEDERPGFGNICVHKGFAPPPHDQAHDNPENGNPEDLPKVARDWPTFNFIIYHSCIRPVLFYNPEPLQNLLKTNPTLQDGIRRSSGRHASLSYPAISTTSTPKSARPSHRRSSPSPRCGLTSSASS